MPRPCVAAIEIVVFDHQIADRGRGHVQPQRLPVVAIVERHVDVAFSAGKEQSLASRILAHDVHRCRRRECRS